MKLLFCPDCWDVFKLSGDIRSCRCGKVVGRYINNLYAETNGKGVCLAINNYEIPTSSPNENRYIECWARPHEGKLNPHTKINSELKVQC
jgi:hypothetical protein